MKKLQATSIIFSLILLVSLLIFFRKPIYETVLLGTPDFKESILAFSEDVCEQKWLSCGHIYNYYISHDWVYFHYDTSFFWNGWKFFSRKSVIWKDLISRLEWVNKEKQIENMKGFSYEFLNLKHIPRWAWN